MKRMMALVVSATLAFHAASGQDPAGTERIREALRSISPHVVPEAERDPQRSALGRSLRELIAAANQSSSEAWSQINSRADWERFRSAKLQALHAALGTLPQRPEQPKMMATGRFGGEGFAIQNLVYESRPGLVVTANLYTPDPPRGSMPGILLSHSHHNPKGEGELQDMGMTWARAGCYVLVPDHLGHGERRQHPFVSAADFQHPFQVSRQDYNFRYDTSLQLSLAGESLMGWMVHDLMTGVDVLLHQPGIDAKRIILLGSVAGGGDPAAVAAALDERISCVVPFNFGGPQPENRYPLPDDAETSFNYAGGGSWESTRNLAHSASAGFLPWAIVASVAPRHLIHAHEFSWDRERDPVWKRYQKIWSLSDATDKLAFTQGRGTIQANEPPASHCNNIGAVHRRLIHGAIKEWFKIDVGPAREYSSRRSREELTCLTDEARRQFQPQLLHEILAAQVAQQLAAARARRRGQSPAEFRQEMRATWSRLLGNIEPLAEAKVRDGSPPSEEVGGISVRREMLETEPGIAVPLMTLSLKGYNGQRTLILGFANDGIAAMLKRREGEIAAALQAGGVVVLVEPRGMGAASSSTDRGQQSAATSHSATARMLGQTMLGGQLRDLRVVWRHVKQMPNVNTSNSIVAGGSDVAPLAPGAAFAYPRRIEGRPAEPQPQAALLALLLALFEDEIGAVRSRGGLVSYQSALDSPFVQIPHESIVPGVLRECDLSDLVAALAPRTVTIEGLFDARGRLVPPGDAVRDK